MGLNDSAINACIVKVWIPAHSIEKKIEYA